MFDSWADAALALLVEMAFKGTLVVLVAWLLARLALRRAAAGTVHAVWVCAAVALLALPVLSLCLPAWTVPLAVAPAEFTVAANEPGPDVVVLAQGPAASLPVPIKNVALDPAVKVPDGAVPPPAAPRTDANSQAANNTFVPGALALMALWLGGVVIAVVWLLGGWLSLVRMARTCRPDAGGTLQTALAAAVAQTGIGRRVRLLVSGQRRIPMTWGVLRPVVLLPDEARAWDAARLRMVLTHELGHVQRWDALWQVLGHLARGLYWFNPLVWLAVRELRVEQERACDDLVLETGISGPDYAENLLAVTAGLRAALWTTPLALGMGRAAQVRRRLVRLLDGGRDHRPVRRGTVARAAAVALALVLPLASLALTWPTAAGAGEAQAQGEQAGQDKERVLLKKLSEARDKLAKHYVTPIDDNQLAEHALKGLLQGLKDPCTDYISSDDLTNIERQLKGSLSGIGVQLKMEEGRLMVATPLEGSPALKAGLQPGDRIEAIDGKTTQGARMDELAKRILGPAGSVVKLKVVHSDGVAQDLAIARGDIRVRTVTGFRRSAAGAWEFTLDAAHGIGYARITQFGRGTAAELKDAVQGLQKEGLKGLIVDLRDCPGGLLDQALEVCKLFVAKGDLLLTTRGPGKEEAVYRADGTDALGSFPLVLIVNDKTASAGEIVAGALRDHDRAILLGTRTFGKGSVQTMVKLDEGGALKVTTGYYFLPSGRNIQRRPGATTWGVDPSPGYYLPLTPPQRRAQTEDAQKRFAIKQTEGAPGKNPPLTPQAIEEKHADPQLAAALRTLVARVTGGEFLKVGQDTGEQGQRAARLDEMRQRREELLRNVSDVEREIADLQGGVK